MAEYKRGTRVLVRAVGDNGKPLRRTWYVATVTRVGRNRNDGLYRVEYDDGELETVELDDILGSTPVRRKRKSAIVGHAEAEKWKVVLREKPIRAGKQPGLTARQILRATPTKPFKVQATYVSVATKSVRKKKDGDYYVQLSRTLTSPAKPGDKPRKHSQRIDILTEGVRDPRARNALLKISCDCEAFKFFFEVALHRRGAADIRFSNGEKPVVTNPQLTPGACKHCVRLLEG